MMNRFYFDGAMGMGFLPWMPVFGLAIGLIALWSIFWKGLALWHAARRGQQWWFLAFLVVNTAGILEIIYLFGFLKLKFSQLFERNA